MLQWAQAPPRPVSPPSPLAAPPRAPSPPTSQPGPVLRQVELQQRQPVPFPQIQDLVEAVPRLRVTDGPAATHAAAASHLADEPERARASSSGVRA